MSARVLVVDDNEDNVNLMATILRRKGFEVDIARNGAGALEAVDRQRPDVILLDMMMPQMDGREVVGHLKANPEHANIPVILVTAKALDSDILAGYELGADYYIPKPFTSRQLLYGIELVLGRESAS